MKKLLGILVLGLLLFINIAEAKVKNIGNGLTINIPNKYKYFEITFGQLISRFPEISLNDEIFEDFGIGLGTKLIVIANNQKTIKFFDDVTSVTGLEKLDRKHLQPLLKKMEDPEFFKRLMRDIQKMYPDKNFETMTEDELAEFFTEASKNSKLEKKFEKVFNPYIKKFTAEYKPEKYTVLLIGDKPAEQALEEINDEEISDLRQNLMDALEEIYEDSKDPSLKDLKDWQFEISKNHNGNLYLYSNDNLQHQYVTSKYYQEFFLTTHNDKIFSALSICAKKCSNTTDFLDIVKPTNLYVKSNSGTTVPKSNDLVEQLNALNELYKSGALTEKEFEKAKKKLLN